MTEPKEVTPTLDLLESTAHLVMRTAGLLDPVRLQAWEELGITLAQLRILFRVRALPGADVRRIAADILIAGIGAAGSGAALGIVMPGMASCIPDIVPPPGAAGRAAARARTGLRVGFFAAGFFTAGFRSEEHTSELQSH